MVGASEIRQCVGFGCFWAWFFLTGTTSVLIGNAPVGFASLNHVVLFLGSSALALASLGPILSRFPQLQQQLRFIAPIFCTVGTLASSFAFSQSVLPPSLLFAGGLVTAGIGMASCKATLMLSLRDCGTVRSIGLTIALGFAVYSLIQVFFEQFLEGVPLVLVTSLLPLALFWTLVFPQNPHQFKRESNLQPIDFIQVVSLQTLGVMLTSMTSGGLWGSFSSLEDSIPTNVPLATLSIVIFLAATYLSMTRYSDRARHDRYRIALWVIVTALVILALAGYWRDDLPEPVTSAAHLFVMSLQLTVIADYSQALDDRKAILFVCITMCLQEACALSWITFVSPRLNYLGGSILLLSLYILTAILAAVSQAAGKESGRKELVEHKIMLSSEELRSRAITDFGLSQRETEVLDLLVEGKTVPQIQEALCIAEGTVKTHLRNIYKKAGVHSRQELMSRYFTGRESGQS